MSDQLTIIKGQLEVDHLRGVIYFHIDNAEEASKFNQVTPLRICSLPKPIPSLVDFQLDINHLHGCSWKLTSGIIEST